MRVQLTDRFCASAKSAEAQTDYFDAAIPGLALRVTSGGTKSWSLLHGAPRRRVSLGRYPSLTLAAARARALEVKDGRSAGTVAALAGVYLRSIQGLRSARQIERRLRKDALPIIGHIQLHELHRRDVTRVIDAKLLDAPITARRVFEDIRAMVRWAVARGDLDHNPIDGMKGPPISKPRTRVLSDDEIRALWQALNEFKPEVAKVIKLCLATAQRIGEVAGMSKDELDLTRKVWNIPGTRTKNGHPHSVPLSPLALDIINQAPLSIDQAQVSSIIHYNQFGLAPRWTAHDCRRSALTGLAKLGIAPIVIANVANHRSVSKAGVTLGTYITYDYENEKREALSLWAKRLQTIIG